MMPEPSDFFTKERVDEQIDQLGESQSVATIESHLIHNLYQYFLDQETDTALAGGAWSRIQRERLLPEIPPATETPPIPPIKRSSHPGTFRDGQRNSWLGAVAVILIVVLGLALFAVHPRSSSTHGIGNKNDETATPLPTATATPSFDWVEATQLGYIAADVDAIPAIAKSNPNVIYEVYQVSATDYHRALRRTDDGGQTWHALSFPVSDGAERNEYFLDVSPLDPNTVFLIIFDNVASDCPSGYGLPNSESGGTSCQMVYVSTDGGVNWRFERLPLNGNFSYSVFDSMELIRAQGQRLYNMTTCSGRACDRLASSLDGGIIWNLIDAPISAAGQDVCDYQITPTGTTLFVFASENCDPTTQTPQFLWRSDDAGSTWVNIGQTPDFASHGMAITMSDDGHALLYGGFDSGVDVNYLSSPSQIKVTADGIIWEGAPTTGFPSDQRALRVLGSLADGSIVVEGVGLNAPYNFTGSTLYTWKRGETSWQQFGKPMKGNIIAMVVIPRDNAPDQVWLLTVERTQVKTATVFHN